MAAQLERERALLGGDVERGLETGFGALVVRIEPHQLALEPVDFGLPEAFATRRDERPRFADGCQAFFRASTLEVRLCQSREHVGHFLAHAGVVADGAALLQQLDGGVVLPALGEWPAHHRVGGRVRKLETERLDVLRKRLRQRVHGVDVAPEELDEQSKDQRKGAVERVTAGFRARLTRCRCPARLVGTPPEPMAPCHASGGHGDGIVSEAKPWLEKYAPKAKIKVLGRHMMFWEDSEAFNKILSDFLGRSKIE